MIYIQQVALVNHQQPDLIDVKALCKEAAPKFVRRTDRFIQLGILGVAQIQSKQKITKNTALYLTSGQGNISVFKRLCDYRFVEKAPPKPVDFINSLSNTAGFYIAKFLDLESKNNNLYHHGFVVEMALLLADCDLKLKKEKQILIGGVDQFIEPSGFAKQSLGLQADSKLGEGSNWMLVNNCREGALASLEVVTESMDLEQIKSYIEEIKEAYQIAFALRCSELDIELLMQAASSIRFHYEQQVAFYETVILYALNAFVQSEKGLLLFVDYFEGKFRLLKLNVF